MKKVIFTIGAVLTLCLISTVNSHSGDKVTICHFPPGNPDNMQTIDISVNALPAHIAHGDMVGGCDVKSLPTTTDTAATTNYIKKP